MPMRGRTRWSANCRWTGTGGSCSTSLILGDPFGFPALLAFAVKLGIAARWAAMKDEAGQASIG